ncbi:DNA N-glycosylase and apurinic/apyrimidinic lyase [Cladorrhinum samala]|uniref:Endonuclease III homolog n=1 Tax=Cladorrhinum samala TaxID=585594 RepID=A0AAV9HIB7_9PEZI|nr:DNA N-glycosylase and apurinic/apyrimidinic lyase [Cladorrhinum samala]
MRTSRVAKETSRLFDSTASSTVPLRRSTRTALARFSYNNNGAGSSTSAASSVNAEEEKDEVTFGSDIEDAVRSTGAATTRKRKRTAAASTASSLSTPRRTSSRIKTENIKPDPEVSEPDDNDVKPAPRTASRVKAQSRAATKREAFSPSPSLPEPKPSQPKSRKQAARLTADGTVLPPTNWEEIYALVKEMRLNGPAANAAVDTMGCERLALPTATAKDRRFHTLVALMLSSQTKDTVNAEAMRRLHTELPPAVPGQPPGLTLENMIAAEPEKLNELIGKVGFHNNKTRYLKQAAEILRDKFGGDIPPTIEGLTSLPGVGPKMAHLCMSAENGWNRVEGIGVDVHVHRITNLWGWQNPPSKSPEETRMALQSWLPRDKWKEINWLLVGFGQSVCLPVGRKCGDCEVGLKGLCKSADRAKVNEGKRRREMEGITAKVEEKEEEEDVEVAVKKEEEEEERNSQAVDEDVMTVKKEEEEEEEEGAEAIGEDRDAQMVEAEGGVEPVPSQKEEGDIQVVKAERTSLGANVVIKKEEDTADEDIEMIKAEEVPTSGAGSAVKKEEGDGDIEMADVEVKPDDVVKEEREAFTNANIMVGQLMKQEEQDTVIPTTEPKHEPEDHQQEPKPPVKTEEEQKVDLSSNNHSGVAIKKEESVAAAEVKVKTEDDEKKVIRHED